MMFASSSSDGQVLYSLHDVAVGTVISNKLKAQADFSVGSHAKNYIVVSKAGNYHIFMPIQNRDGHFIDSLAMIFDKSVVDEGIGQFVHMSFKIMIGLALGAALVLIFLLRIVPVLDEEGRIRQKTFLVVFVTVLATTQLIFAFINNNNFKEI